MANRNNGRNDKSPAVRGLTKACKEGRMEDRKKLTAQICKLVEGADEQQLRLLLIATKGILRK